MENTPIDNSAPQPEKSGKQKGVSIIKRLGWAGFFFFLIKGVTLYIVLPLLVYFGVIEDGFFSGIWETIKSWFS